MLSTNIDIDTPCRVVRHEVQGDVMDTMNSGQVHQPGGGFFLLSRNRTLTSIPS